MNKLTQEQIKMLKKIGLFFIIIILIALIYAFFIKDYQKKGHNQYLIIGNYLILQKTNSGWEQITEFNEELEKNLYTITDGTNTYKDVTLQYYQNHNWYFFDKEYNQINMPNFKIATLNLDIKLANYQIQNINIEQDKYATEVLNDNNAFNKNSYVAYKVDYDFDNDGNIETIYTLNNSSLEVTSGTQKGFMFAVKNNKITMLKNQEDTPYNIMEILDIDNDGNYEFIATENVIDLPTLNSCYLIYDLEDNKWNLKHDCINQ